MKNGIIKTIKYYKKKSDKKILILKKINFFSYLKYNIILNFSKKVSGLPLANKGLDFIASYSKSNFISYIIRPKYSKNYKLISTEEIDKKEFGIIVQGPISTKKRAGLS